MRLQRADFFMEVARLNAQRSTCIRGQVGAVIVRDRHIVAHGYNGAPSGMAQCDEVGCDVLEVIPVVNGLGGENLVIGCQRAIHAEANAIAFSAKMGIPLDLCTMYSTAEPCRKCSELIIQAGISQVVFEDTYRLGAARFLDSANVIVKQHAWTPRG